MIARQDATHLQAVEGRAGTVATFGAGCGIPQVAEHLEAEALDVLVADAVHKLQQSACMRCSLRVCCQRLVATHATATITTMYAERPEPTSKACPTYISKQRMRTSNFRGPSFTVGPSKESTKTNCLMKSKLSVCTNIAKWSRRCAVPCDTSIHEYLSAPSRNETYWSTEFQRGRTGRQGIGLEVRERVPCVVA